MSEAPIWEKVLYKKQNYPDNYVDSSYFLKELKKNLNTPTYTVRDLIESSQLVLRPFTLVCLFLCLYYYLREGRINPFVLLLSSFFIFLLSSVANTGAIEQYLKPYLFLHIFLTGISPILCTLTQSISNDTLWAMTVGMLLFHLIFYSYKQNHSLLSNAISLNAVVFATVCLASMLSTALNGFVLVSISMHIFIFGPKFERYMVLNNVLLTVCTSILLCSISLTLAVGFMAITLSVVIVFPRWLHSLQDIKNNIYGPWDEAVI